MRFLRFGRKKRSDGIASKQMRLVRASMTNDPISFLRFGRDDRWQGEKHFAEIDEVAARKRIYLERNAIKCKNQKR